MRLICVSSIFQLILAITCARYNDKRKKLKNIILVTNPNFHRNNKEKIIYIKKIFKFCKIVDCSKFVKKLNNKNYTKFQIFLKKKINFQIQEILVRYKFNIAEHVIFSTFPSANISIFEDGIGDYMRYDLLTGKRKKNSLRDFIHKLYYFFFNNKIFYNFINNETYKNKILNKFELIRDYNGHLKNQHCNKKKFILIKNEFLKSLKILKKRHEVKFKKNTAIVLLHDIDDINNNSLKKNSELKQNIYYFLKFLNKLKKQYKNHNIVIKAHPNVKKTTVKTLKKIYNLDVLDTHEITETLLIDPNITLVAGFLSSSLIYSKNIFKKETISVNTKMLKFSSVYDQEKSIYDVIKRYKIKIIY